MPAGERAVGGCVSAGIGFLIGGGGGMRTVEVGVMVCFVVDLWNWF